MTNELLTERECGALLRLKVKTLQAWRGLKKGPRFVRLGSRVFYPRAEVDRFLSHSLVETEDTESESDAR
jgi:hypothetical protein